MKNICLTLMSLIVSAVCVAQNGLDSYLGTYYVQQVAGDYSYIYNSESNPLDTQWHPFCFHGHTMEIALEDLYDPSDIPELMLPVELRGFARGDETVKGQLNVINGTITIPQQPIYDLYELSPYNTQTCEPMDGVLTMYWSDGCYSLVNWTVNYYGWTYVRNSHSIFIKPDGVRPDVPVIQLAEEIVPLDNGSRRHVLVCNVKNPATGSDADGNTVDLLNLTHVVVTLNGDESSALVHTLSEPGESLDFRFDVEPLSTNEVSVRVGNCHEESDVATATLTASQPAIGIDAAQTAPAEYYNMLGVRVPNPVSGQMYICVRPGAESTKVVYP